MGLFSRFNKNRKNTVLPTEVDEYYKSEMRTRRSTSVLFALFALIVTLVVAAGLFFGGRAIYRALTDDNQNQTQVDENKDKSSDNNAQSSPTTESGNSSQTSEPTTSNESGSTSTGSSALSTESGGSSASTASPQSTVPATGDEPAALPHTGD